MSETCNWQAGQPMDDATRKNIHQVLDLMEAQLSNKALHADVCQLRFEQLLDDDELMLKPSLLGRHIMDYAHGQPLAEMLEYAVLRAMSIGYELGRAGIIIPATVGDHVTEDSPVH